MPRSGRNWSGCQDERERRLSNGAVRDRGGGVAWIDNFLPDDRELAKRLLDAFVLDGWTAARASLLELLRTEIDSVRNAGPRVGAAGDGLG